MTEEKLKISRVILSKILSILRSHNQLLKMERVISTLLREALIPTNSKTQTISCLNMTFLTSKTLVKPASLAQALVSLAVTCFRVQIHSIRTTPPCKCSCQIMRRTFLLYLANDLKELILKCWISRNTFMNFRFKLIKDWVTWLKIWHCFTRIWTKLTIRTQ